MMEPMKKGGIKKPKMSMGKMPKLGASPKIARKNKMPKLGGAGKEPKLGGIGKRGAY